MPDYLRKKGTNEIFIKTEFIEDRPDLEPYLGPIPPIGEPVIAIEAPSEPGITTEAIIPKVSEPGLVNDSETDAVNANMDLNRIAVIKQAIELLPLNEFTAQGLPKVDALSAKVGFQITREERDFAFTELKAKR